MISCYALISVNSLPCKKAYLCLNEFDSFRGGSMISCWGGGQYFIFLFPYSSKILFFVFLRAACVRACVCVCGGGVRCG